MSPVEFKKRPCHPVEIKAQGPLHRENVTVNQYNRHGHTGLCEIRQATWGLISKGNRPPPMDRWGLRCTGTFH